MSELRQFLCAKLECGQFNRIALFSASGLSISLVLVFGYDLQIAEWWL
jgi:hypothetical protein